MCGLVGLIHNTNSGFNAKDLQAFEEMLYVDALRGDDATGVACITTKQGAKVFKAAEAAAWFVWDKEYTAARNSFLTNGKALLGHNRKATIGGRKDENAHPFVFDDRYVFFHNGTLNNHRKLADTEVDSEALGMHVVKCEGDVNKLGELLDTVSGAYACVWYDADQHKVFMMRNHERPLSILLFENGSMAYASEAWIAAGPASRCYLKVKEVINVVPSTLYSIDLKEMVPKLSVEPIPKKAIPSMTHTSTVIGGITKQIVGIGKRQVKNVLNAIKTNYVGFFIDDLQCCHLDPQVAEVYDYVFTGTHDDYPGTVFKFISKDLFPYEADEMLGKYVSAIYDQHSFQKGNVLEVWVTKPVWKPSKPQQQVVH
jgi:asparagine synthetase B (glutamine-hydrolysing)